MRGFILAIVLAATAVLNTYAADEAPIKIGIIGADTSHASAFTGFFNDPKNTGDLAGFKVVAAYSVGSPDIPSSVTAVDVEKKKLVDAGVEMVDSLEALLAKVDAVLLEAVDGRPHLKQATAVIKAKKPLFVDKPTGGTLADAIEIFRLAKEENVPIFSGSSLRFCTDIGTFRDGQDKRVGDVVGCMAWSPAPLEPHHPDLYWYGIHGVELLFTVMGPGCVSVQRTHNEGTDIVTGTWKDGRVATFRGIRSGARGYGAVVFGSKGIVQTGGYDSYKGLVAQIGKFFKTKITPVPADETLEIHAFMEAADESKRQGGMPVTLETVMAKARQAGK